MINNILSLFQYDFFINAIIVGTLITVCAALLGVSLVLKRYSMIGDGLSHVSFGASAVAVAVGVTPIYIALPVVLLSAFFLLKINSSSKIKGDAATALVSSSALAIGYITIKLSGGANVDINNYMFGSIYTINRTDMAVSCLLSAAVILLYVFFYNKLFAVTFDEDFALATGIKAKKYNMLLSCLTAITVVIGMRMMGALLISSLIIFPVLTSSRIFKTYKRVLLSSLVISLCCFLLGLVFSVLFETSPGASIVVINLIAFLIASILGKKF